MKLGQPSKSQRRLIRQADDLLGENRLVEAVALFEHVLDDLAADDKVTRGVVLEKLGGAYRILGDPTRSEERYRNAVQLRPKSEWCSIGLFHALFELGRQDEALAEIGRFLRVRPRGGPDKEHFTLIRELHEGMISRRK